MAPFFFFDFTLNQTAVKPMEDIPEQIFKKPAQRAEQTNLCPYPIPKIDDIVKDIDSCTYHVDKHKFVSDLFECGAIAISNAVDLTQKDEREERYMQIINNYKPRNKKALRRYSPKSMHCSLPWFTTTVISTTTSVRSLCAVTSATKPQDSSLHRITSRNLWRILTVSDPCCGGGGMLIAALDVLHSFGVNYARNCFMEGSDVDLRCVHMTYLQLALAGVPAIVRHQNTLTRECWSVWYTPAYLFQYLRFRKFDNPYDNPKFQEQRRIAHEKIRQR